MVLGLAVAIPVVGRAEVIPIVVEGDGCTLVVETKRPDEHFYLVVGSLGDAAQSSRVTVQAEATGAAVHLPVAHETPPAIWRELVQDQAARQHKARQRRRPSVFTPTAAPEKSRTFHVFIADRGLDNPAHYAEVTADLRAVGRHLQVYVDRSAAQPGLAALAADILHTFDAEVFPWASRHLGTAQDVDRDGRFTVLLTPWLGKLQGGAVSVDGFVRGSDFTLDVAPPFSNRCDMMVLNSRLQPGRHLRTLLAHEYTHAVLYCEHVLEDYLPGVTRQDEEGWLNEGLAHLVEEQMAYGWSNLDHRIAAYLSYPERYPLTVPDYFHAGLWRTAGTRGAAFLFLRSCRERHGVELLTRLARSNLAGIPNLEAATQERFVDLFRRWGVAQLLDVSAWTRPARFDRLCVGPRYHDVATDAGLQPFNIAGTAQLYLRLHAAAPGRMRVTIRGAKGAGLQVTLVRPAPDQPWLELRPTAGPAGQVRLALTAHCGAVRIEAASWERLLPTGKAGDETGVMPAGAGWFGAGELKSGQTRLGAPIELPASLGGAAIVFKVLGRDAAGRALAAWAVLAHNRHGDRQVP